MKTREKSCLLCLTTGLSHAEFGEPTSTEVHNRTNRCQDNPLQHPHGVLEYEVRESSDTEANTRQKRTKEKQNEYIRANSIHTNDLFASKGLDQ